MITKTFIRRHKLTIDNVIHLKLDDNEYKAIENVLYQMSKQDEEILKKEESFNTLESYILDMRNHISDANSSLYHYFPIDEIDNFRQLLNTAEDWMYDTFDATAKDLDAKLNELKAIGSIAQEKKISLQINDCINEIELLIEKYQSINDHEELSSFINTLQKWLIDCKEKRNKVKLYQAQPIDLSQYQDQLNQFQKLIQKYNASKKEQKDEDKQEKSKDEKQDEKQDEEEVLQLENL